MFRFARTTRKLDVPIFDNCDNVYFHMTFTTGMCCTTSDILVLPIQWIQLTVYSMFHGHTYIAHVVKNALPNDFTNVYRTFVCHAYN